MSVMTKLLRAAPWLFAMALAVQPLPSGAEPLSFQEQRLLMRQVLADDDPVAAAKARPPHCDHRVDVMRNACAGHTC